MQNGILKKRSIWCVAGLLLIGIPLGRAMMPSRAGATGADSIRLEACQMELESEKRMRAKYEQRLAEKEQEYRAKLKEREETWRNVYERVKAERAGEWCWEKLHEAEDNIEREQRFCRWRLRNAGLIRYKTVQAVKRLDKSLFDAGAELLTPAEKDKLDE